MNLRTNDYYSHLQGSNSLTLDDVTDSLSETSVTNYQSTTCKIPEDWRSRLHRGWRLKFPIKHQVAGLYNRAGVFTARYVLHSTFCPNRVFMCFVWIGEQTAIISLYSTDWLVSITEKECVYCAVRSTLYVLPKQCIYVFCVDLSTNSDYFPIQH